MQAARAATGPLRAGAPPLSQSAHLNIPREAPAAAVKPLQSHPRDDTAHLHAARAAWLNPPPAPPSMPTARSPSTVLTPHAVTVDDIADQPALTLAETPLTDTMPILPSYRDAKGAPQGSPLRVPAGEGEGGGLDSPSSAVAASWQLYDEALRRFEAACDESDLLLKREANASLPTHARGFSPPTARAGRVASPPRPPPMSPPVLSQPAPPPAATAPPSHWFGAATAPAPTPAPAPTSASAPPTNIQKIVEEARAVMAQASNVLRSTPPPYYDPKADL
eukprot:TRINITY_DN19704_c0_g1_i2.p1 TRINITY_DN19704_c0_g1~~TRINITY_DN19704_c0_g1_i2.p1  ORF type:complete len:278 (+),score=59.17 TRINITY_DN19704_c0_g1_i2:484-1317(+)